MSTNKYPSYMLAAIALVGVENIAHLFPKPKPPRIFTSADEERKAKAQEKRERKAAKRARGTITRRSQWRTGLTA